MSPFRPPDPNRPPTKDYPASRADAIRELKDWDYKTYLDWKKNGGDIGDLLEILKDQTGRGLPPGFSYRWVRQGPVRLAGGPSSIADMAAKYRNVQDLPECNREIQGQILEALQRITTIWEPVDLRKKLRKSQTAIHTAVFYATLWEYSCECADGVWAWRQTDIGRSEEAGRIRYRVKWRLKVDWDQVGEDIDDGPWFPSNDPFDY